MEKDGVRRVLQLPQRSLSKMLPRLPPSTPLGIRVTNLGELAGLDPHGQAGGAKSNPPEVKIPSPPYSIDSMPETGGYRVIVTTLRCGVVERITFELVQGGGEVPGVLELCLLGSPVRYVPLEGLPNPVVTEKLLNPVTGVLSLYFKERNAEQ